MEKELWNTVNCGIMMVINDESWGYLKWLVYSMENAIEMDENWG